MHARRRPSSVRLVCGRSGRLDGQSDRGGGPQELIGRNGPVGRRGGRGLEQLGRAEGFRGVRSLHRLPRPSGREKRGGRGGRAHTLEAEGHGLVQRQEALALARGRGSDQIALGQE